MTVTSLTPRSTPSSREIKADPLSILQVAESEDEARFIFAREPRAFWAYFLDIELEWFQLEFILAAEHHHRLMGKWPAGFGKALAPDTPIPTPQGWTTIGELRPGDEVFGAQGQRCHVTDTRRWQDRMLYQVTMDSGEEIIADEEHEWLVQFDPRKPAKIRTTKDIARSRRHRARIALAAPLRMHGRKTALDPYCLGVWLGDGHADGARITQGEEDYAFIRDQFEQAGYPTTDQSVPTTFGVRGRFYHHLARQGLIKNKHIPETYLRAAISQRLALLQGLIDSDGHVAKSGAVEYCSVNKRLAMNVLHLVRTLGVKATMICDRASLGGQDCGPRYRVHFHHNEAARLPRKLSRCRTASKYDHHYVEAKIWGRGESVCIEVDSPDHLYLAGHAFVPTHNSTNMSYGYPIWHVARNPNVRIIQIGKTTEEMDAYALLIRNTLEKNERLNQWYGPFRDPDPSGRRTQQWSSSGINVYKRQIEDPHSTIEWYGSNSDAVLGHRCDIIIPDDVVTPDTAGTPERRQKLLYRFREQWQTAPQYRFPVKPFPVTKYPVTNPEDGKFRGYLQIPEGIFWPEGVEYEKIDVVGTVFHHLDLYHTLEKDVTFHTIHHDCFVQNAAGVLDSLWPDRWSLAKLETERRSQGTISFNRRYRNLCTAEEDLAFKLIYFEGGDEGERHYPGCLDRTRSFGHRKTDWNVVCSLDPASGTRSVNAAMPAMVVVGYDHKDKTHKRYLIDTWSDYAGYFAVLDQVLQFHDQYKFDLFVVEINAFGKWLMDENAPQIMELKSRGVRIVPHTTGVNKKDKVWGVKSMEPFFMDGLWSLPYAGPSDQKKLEPLYEEFKMYPQGLTDYCMAMWFADLQIRKGTRSGGIIKPDGGPVYSRINIAQQIADRRAKRLAKGLQPGQDR